MHIAYVRTDSYNARLYEYEDDLPGACTSTVLYGNGIRWYVLGTMQITAHVRLSIKYSGTLHDGATSIGTGADEIPGDTQRTAGVQLDWRL